MLPSLHAYMGSDESQFNVSLTTRDKGAGQCCYCCCCVPYCPRMLVDIIIRDKLRPMREHGSVLLYVHGNQKAR